MNHPFAIIKRRKLWLTISMVLMLFSVVLFFTQVRYSIQFTGGMEFVVPVTDVQQDVQAAVEDALSQA